MSGDGDDFDFGQISLNLDTSFKPRPRKQKVDKVQLTGNTRSRIKQKREIKRNQEPAQDANNENEKSETPAQGGKKRKHVGDGKAMDKSENHQRFGKHRKTDGIISSLFHKNPEIPHIENSQVDALSEKVFAGKTFKELPLHPYLVSNLEEKLGFKELTQIQKKAIPVLLQRRDALIKSQTGSGKTLAYAVPIIQSIQAFPRKVKREDGPYALIIVPTRELVLQTYDIFSKLLRTFIWIVPGCLMGGEKRKAEKSRLRKGVNILVTTPGRLLDHINSTYVLSLAHIHWLVIDEADRLLELGYERDVAQILNALNSQCVNHTTVLLSATLSEGVERLSSVTLRDPVHISISAADDKTISTNEHADIMEVSNGETSTQDGFSVPSQLNQFFIITPCKLRLVMLASWILWKCRYTYPTSKMIVFMSTQQAVEFHWQLFNRVLNNQPAAKMIQQDGTKTNIGTHGQSSQRTGGMDGGKKDMAIDGGKKEKKEKNKTSQPPMPLFHLHGEMRQKERTDTFHKFSQAKSGILLCTDVAARGLDLPHVDWIVQYTLPGQTVDYIHRIGRTARAGSKGQSLLFLMPSEVDYVNELNKHHLSLSQMDTSKILQHLLIHIKDFQTQRSPQSARQMPRTHEEAATFLQDRFEEMLRKDNDLHQIAGKAFQSYVRAYATYSKEVKAILKAKELHLGHVAKSCGLREAPSQVHGLSAKDRAEFMKIKKEKNKKCPRPMSFRQAAMSEYSSGLMSYKKKAKSVTKWN